MTRPKEEDRRKQQRTQSKAEDNHRKVRYYRKDEPTPDKKITRASPQPKSSRSNGKKADLLIKKYNVPKKNIYCTRLKARPKCEVSTSEIDESEDWPRENYRRKRRLRDGSPTEAQNQSILNKIKAHRSEPFPYERNRIARPRKCNPFGSRRNFSCEENYWPSVSLTHVEECQTCRRQRMRGLVKRFYDGSYRRRRSYYVSPCEKCKRELEVTRSPYGKFKKYYESSNETGMKKYKSKNGRKDEDEDHKKNSRELKRRNLDNALSCEVYKRQRMELSEKKKKHVKKPTNFKLARTKSELPAIKRGRPRKPRQKTVRNKIKQAFNWVNWAKLYDRLKKRYFEAQDIKKKSVKKRRSPSESSADFNRSINYDLNRRCLEDVPSLLLLRRSNSVLRVINDAKKLANVLRDHLQVRSSQNLEEFTRKTEKQSDETENDTREHEEDKTEEEPSGSGNNNPVVEAKPEVRDETKNEERREEGTDETARTEEGGSQGENIREGTPETERREDREEEQPNEAEEREDRGEEDEESDDGEEGEECEDSEEDEEMYNYNRNRRRYN